ncbi:hypothetical protein PT974_08116 [Cladobotryum mycophilum]|uniref:Uncharacterized protein n=1 Tax=Cladobotryum mycophilum TaxID=491253 RepID=A0ABR0SD08_9HYPO
MTNPVTGLPYSMFPDPQSPIFHRHSDHDDDSYSDCGDYTDSDDYSDSDEPSNTKDEPLPEPLVCRLPYTHDGSTYHHTDEIAASFSLSCFLDGRLGLETPIPEGIVFNCKGDGETIFDIDDLGSISGKHSEFAPNYLKPGDFDSRRQEPKGPDVFMREINNLGFLTLKGFLRFLYRKEIFHLLSDGLDGFRLHDRANASQPEPRAVLSKASSFYAWIWKGIEEAWDDPRVYHKLMTRRIFIREDYVVRFALRLGSLCDGELTGLKHCRNAKVWAWAAIELARVYVRMHPDAAPTDGRAVLHPDIKAKRPNPKIERMLLDSCKPASSTIWHDQIRQVIGEQLEHGKRSD